MSISIGGAINWGIFNPSLDLPPHSGDGKSKVYEKPLILDKQGGVCLPVQGSLKTLDEQGIDKNLAEHVTMTIRARMTARAAVTRSRAPNFSLEVRELCGKLAVGFAERAGDVRQLFARLSAPQPLPMARRLSIIPFCYCADASCCRRSGFGFHSRTSLCAAAICSEVILAATLSRRSTAFCAPLAAASVNHLCAMT